MAGGRRANPNVGRARAATDAKTAATVRDLMEDVILEGTGQRRSSTDGPPRGKSGTAQKIDPATGRYSPTQYNASFVGFAPVNDPAVTILVVLDSPVGAHMEAEVSGPVFKRVAEQVLAYLTCRTICLPSDRSCRLPKKRSRASLRAAGRGSRPVRSAVGSNRRQGGNWATRGANSGSSSRPTMHLEIRKP